MKTYKPRKPTKQVHLKSMHIPKQNNYKTRISTKKVNLQITYIYQTYQHYQ